jgi:hypothetical protein
MMWNAAQTYGWLARTIQLQSTRDSTPDRQLNILKFVNSRFWYKTMDSLSLQIKYELMKIATEGKAQYNKTAHTKLWSLLRWVSANLS